MGSSAQAFPKLQSRCCGPRFLLKFLGRSQLLSSFVPSLPCSTEIPVFLLPVSTKGGPQHPFGRLALSISSSHSSSLLLPGPAQLERGPLVSFSTFLCHQPGKVS